MAAKSVAAPPRLYLGLPATLDDAALGALPALLGAADVAAVLLKLAAGDPRSLVSRVKQIAPLVQGVGAALLLDGHADSVARGGADGSHLTGLETLAEALPSLKPDRIAGVGGLSTRHDAMTAGESGADYLLFGEPDAHGQRPSADAIAERIDWWAELFEPPCVAYAASLAEAALFASARADFVLMDDAIWRDPRGAQAALMDAAAAIRQAASVSHGKAKAGSD